MQVKRRTDEIIRDAFRVIRARIIGIWRFRWVTMTILWISCVLGWGAVYLMPDVYSANARVFVDTENSIDNFLGGLATSTDVISEVNVVVREMVSRPNLAEVARNTNLQHRAENDAEFQDLLTSLKNRISVTSNRDGEYAISFEDTDRQMALAVVDNLLTTFVQKSLGADRTDTEQAQKFLQKQIGEYEDRLTAAENRLADFKRENVALMPDQRGDYFSRYQAAESALQVTSSKLKLAEERRAELSRQIDGEAPVFGFSPSTTAPDSRVSASATSAKIRELELQLDELRLQYTDKHPRIGQVLETIEILKKQEAQERESRLQAAHEQPLRQNPLEQNPVYQNMRIQLTSVDVELASLRAERSQQQAEVARLKKLVDTIPQVEAELNRLNRDYDVIKAKHRELLQQLETASIGEDVSRSMDEVQFRVIDPPFSESEPVGPNRPIYLAAVSFLGLVFSFLVAFLLDQLNPTFIGHQSVTEVLGIPVLASVSLLQSDLEKWKERRENFALQAVALMLLISFVVTIAFSGHSSATIRNIIMGVL